MNQLKTNQNGGFPFELDDIRFLDQAYRDAFSAIMKGFNRDYIILDGLVQTVNGANLDVSDGWAFYEDEIIYVPAASFAVVVGNHVFLSKNIFDEPTSVELFEDGNSYATESIRQGVLTYGSASINPRLNTVETIQEILSADLGINDIKQIKRKKIKTTFPAMTWNATLNLWETKIAHGLIFGSIANVLGTHISFEGTVNNLFPGVLHSFNLFDGSSDYFFIVTDLIYVTIYSTDPAASTSDYLGIPGDCPARIIIEYDN